MSTYFRLLRFLKPQLNILWLAVTCMVVSSLLGGVELGALIPLADRIVTNQAIASPSWLPAWLAGVVAWFNQAPPLQLLTGLAVSLPLLFLVKGLMEFLQTYFMSDVAQRMLRDLRQRLFNHVVTLSLDYHAKHPTGMTISRIITDTGFIQNNVAQGGYELVYQSLQAMVFLTIAFIIHWKLALITLILVPLIAWPMMRIGKFLKKRARQAHATLGELNHTLVESLTGLRVIQAFQSERVVQEKFGAVAQQFYRLQRKIVKRTEGISPITETIGACGGAVVFWYGGRAVLQHELTLGTFLVFLGSMLSLIRPFKRLARLHSANQQMLASAERVFEVLDVVSTIRERPGAISLPGFQRQIVYEGVSFQYDSQPVLRDLTLTISKGEILALVGPSGAGKSTLVDLLPRFHDVRQGRILIDGIDIRSVTLPSLRSLIAVVTQQTTLFNDTVHANIALGRPEATRAEVIESAQAANAHDFICRLAEGYDTVIGERGESLSGGERQRMAIARAFLSQRPILILDEATSQLDAESEHLVTEAIERIMRGRTVLLIAHRLSTVRLAHRIVLLQEGRIVEHGSHDELVQKSPLYRRFCELQLMHV